MGCTGKDLRTTLPEWFLQRRQNTVPADGQKQKIQWDFKHNNLHFSEGRILFYSKN
jgi:hypothetical protein